VSKRRLVITAVTVQGLSQRQVAARYGVSQGWISRVLARYRVEGEAAFEPRSTRPKASPRATNPEVVDLVLTLRKELAGQGLDAGAQTICWHLAHHHAVTVSAAIDKVMRAAILVVFVLLAVMVVSTGTATSPRW
jgi:transposase